MSDDPTSQYPIPDSPPPGGRPPSRRGYWSSTPPWYVMMVSAILMVMLAILLILLFRDGGTETTAGDDTTTSFTDTTVPSTATVPTSGTSSSTSTSASTTTTSTSTSTTAGTTGSTATTATTTSSSTSTTVDPAVYETAVWPWPASPVRYDDPVEAARGFAIDFLGFEQVFAGEFMQGDSRSGEVEIQSFQPGPTTVVFVRQLGPGNSWWVLGSATDNIRIDEPDALDRIDSPLTVGGESVAFEAAVDVELRVDGSSTPLVRDFVMGGVIEPAPFAGTFTFDDPGEGRGALVLFTMSAEDGGIQEASVRRVVFG